MTCAEKIVLQQVSLTDQFPPSEIHKIKGVSFYLKLLQPASLVSFMLMKYHKIVCESRSGLESEVVTTACEVDVFFHQYIIYTHENKMCL